MAVAGRRTAGPKRGTRSALLSLLIGLKRELAAAAGLALAAAAGYGLWSAVRVEPEIPPLDGAFVPLDDEMVDAWARASEAVAALRQEGLIGIPARTVPEYLEWVRRNRDTIAEAAPDLDPETYAGLTRSLARARAWEIRLYEWGATADAQEKAWKMAERSGQPFAPIPPPELAEQEMLDLRAYENWWNPIETALLALMPGITPPVPVEEEVVPAAGDGEAGEGASAGPPRTIRWRVVNASRYGPRVVRAR